MIIITLGIITKGMGGDFKRFAGLGLEGTGRLWINTWGQHTPRVNTDVLPVYWHDFKNE